MYMTSFTPPVAAEFSRYGQKNKEFGRHYPGKEVFKIFKELSTSSYHFLTQAQLSLDMDINLRDMIQFSSTFEDSHKSPFANGIDINQYRPSSKRCCQRLEKTSLTVLFSCEYSF